MSSGNFIFPSRQLGYSAVKLHRVSVHRCSNSTRNAIYDTESTIGGIFPDRKERPLEILLRTKRARTFRDEGLDQLNPALRTMRNWFTLVNHCPYSECRPSTLTNTPGHQAVLGEMIRHGDDDDKHKSRSDNDTFSIILRCHYDYE